MLVKCCMKNGVMCVMILCEGLNYVMNIVFFGLVILWKCMKVFILCMLWCIVLVVICV